MMNDAIDWRAAGRALSALLLLSAGLLSGCMMAPPARPNDPAYAPALAPTPRALAGSNGSLYVDNGNMDLFADRKARRIGDLITIELDESTSSSKSSNIDVSKQSDVSVPDVGLFGRSVTSGGLNLASEFGADRNFAGNAGAGQSNNLNGEITVSVVDVWPNGTLVIRGEKWMTLNRGDEFIRITGLVRPDDVSPDNTVLSTKVADARISYSGTGSLAQSQVMGWLGRFFNSGYWSF